MGWRSLNHSTSVKSRFAVLSSTQDINDNKPQVYVYSWLKPFAVINLPHVGFFFSSSSAQNDPETECRFKPISSPGSCEWPSRVDIKWTVSVTCPSVPEPWLLRARCHSARWHFHTHAHTHACMHARARTHTHSCSGTGRRCVGCVSVKSHREFTHWACLPTWGRGTRIWSFISSCKQAEQFFTGGV